MLKKIFFKNQILIIYNLKNKSFILLKNKRIIWTMFEITNLKQKNNKIFFSNIFLNYIYFLLLLINFGLINQNSNKLDYVKEIIKKKANV